MSKDMTEIVAMAVRDQEQAAEIMDKLFAVAKPGAVFSEPVTVGDYTVITASEVKVGMGFGYGSGGGSGTAEERESEEADAEEAAGTGFGAGGGGGGASSGRPVAAISIGPGGVRVEPVVDATTLGLAFFTTIGGMFMMLMRMRRAARE
jgi:uncharacterized spore protein YtfJ